MEMKEVGDLVVNRDEPLTLPRRFEAPVRLIAAIIVKQNIE